MMWFQNGWEWWYGLRDKSCVPGVLELKKSILEEGHKSSLSIYPDAIKMY